MQQSIYGQYALPKKSLSIQFQVWLNRHGANIIIALLVASILFLLGTFAVQKMELNQKRVVLESKIHALRALDEELFNLQNKINMEKNTVTHKASKELGMIQRNAKEAISLQSNTSNEMQWVKETPQKQFEAFNLIEAVKSIFNW